MTVVVNHRRRALLVTGAALFTLAGFVRLRRSETVASGAVAVLIGLSGVVLNLRGHRLTMTTEELVLHRVARTQRFAAADVKDLEVETTRLNWREMQVLLVRMRDGSSYRFSELRQRGDVGPAGEAVAQWHRLHNAA